MLIKFRLVYIFIIWFSMSLVLISKFCNLVYILINVWTRLNYEVFQQPVLGCWPRQRFQVPADLLCTLKKYPIVLNSIGVLNLFFILLHNKQNSLSICMHLVILRGLNSPTFISIWRHNALSVVFPFITVILFRNF